MEGFRCGKRLTRPGSKLWPSITLKKGQNQTKPTENWFVRDDIAAEIQDDERFNKLDKEEIQHAIDTLNGELHFERIRQNAASFFMNEGKLDWDGEEVITSNNSDLSKDVDKAAILEKFPSLNLDSNVHEVDKYVMSDPIFTLVLQALLKDRTLDWEPEVELKTLKEVYPFYYYDFFIAEEQKYKAQGQLKMAGRPVGVIPTTYNKVPRGLPACKPEHVKAAMSAVEKVEEELLSDARRKYTVLVEKLNGSKVHGKAKKRKTEPELPDDVMSE